MNPRGFIETDSSENTHNRFSPATRAPGTNA